MTSTNCFGERGRVEEAAPFRDRHDLVLRTVQEEQRRADLPDPGNRLERIANQHPDRKERIALLPDRDDRGRRAFEDHGGLFDVRGEIDRDRRSERPAVDHDLPRIGVKVLPQVVVGVARVTRESSLRRNALQAGESPILRRHHVEPEPGELFVMQDVQPRRDVGVVAVQVDDPGTYLGRSAGARGPRRLSAHDPRRLPARLGVDRRPPRMAPWDADPRGAGPARRAGSSPAKRARPSRPRRRERAGSRGPRAVVSS